MSLRQKTAKDSGLLSSTPHAPRQRKPFPFGPSHPEKQRRYIDVNKVKAWSTTDLIKLSARDDKLLRSRPSDPLLLKEPIEPVKTIIVKPFRRAIGHKAPDGVPTLDLSRFNEADEQMDPIEIICVPNSDEEYSVSRTDISWGTPRLPFKPDASNDEEREEEEMEREVSSEKGKRDSISCDETSNSHHNLTPIGLSSNQMQYVESKLMSHERGKMEPFYRKQDKLSVASMVDVGLSKRIKFGARILSQNGRDVHRELCGFFFLNDGSLTIYEFRQFGQRLSALPLLSRAIYKFPRGRREGEQYEIRHIRRGSTLYFDTSSVSSLPESLRRRPLLAIRVTQVDEQAKWNIMKEGFKPSEYSKLRDYLSQPPSEETQRTETLLATLQGMLRNRMQGCACQVLLGLGRLLRRLANEEGFVGQLQLQQALRAYHISLTPEDFQQLWDSLRDCYFVTSTSRSRGGNGSGREEGNERGQGGEGIWLEWCITGLVGDLKEERQLILRKVFQKIDPGKRGFIQLSDLLKCFCPANHPDALSGKKTVDEIVHTVVGYLQSPYQQPGYDRNHISYADFENYYSGVSIDTRADHEYVHLLRRCWSV